MDLNDWILTQSGGRWDNPKSVQYLLDDENVKSDVEQYIRDSLASPKAFQYFGLRYLLLLWNGSLMPRRWGWKDPRNTFTLPIWRSIYPDAKIVHIARHGVAVAASLNGRYHLEHTKRSNEYNANKAYYAFLNKKDGFTDSVRCSTLAGAFGLWEEYMEQAVRQMDEVGDQGLSIKYEEILNQPIAGLERISAFCELPRERKALEDITRVVRAERAFAFRRDKGCASYADSVRKRLERFGYRE